MFYLSSVTLCMFNTDEKIQKLIQILKDRKVNLTHACQLKDFKSYLAIGGIPSRKLLSERGRGYTTFETDEVDKSNDVWSKVFCNLQDLGIPFHMFKSGVPTPYGPILIKLDPEVLENATDVAICLRSAGVKNFDRNRESLSTIDEIERLFKNSKDSKFPSDIHFIKNLKEVFDKEKEVTSSPEVSVTMEKFSFGKGIAKIDYINEILVDPLVFDKKDLFDEVKELSESHYNLLGTFVRSRQTKNLNEYNELIFESIKNQFSFDLLSEIYGDEESHPLKKLIVSLTTNNTGYMYDRFLKYLIEGTLKELGLVNEEEEKEAI